jgi:hypothetical protein
VRHSKLLNRFILEVRGGIVLYLNRTAGVADGWWWGADTDALQHGPFASSQEALADARRDDACFRIVHWDKAVIKRDEPELRPTGHIVVVDTAGTLWVRTGEEAPEGWHSGN